MALTIYNIAQLTILLQSFFFKVYQREDEQGYWVN